MCRSLFVMLFGLLLVAIGLGFWWYNRQFFQQPNLRTAEGEVVEILQVRGKKGFKYKPIFKFTATDGKEYQIESEYSSSSPQYRVGERETLYYPDGQPYEARVRMKGLVRFIPFVFVGVGLMLMFLSMRPR